jgi:hypothetical protein
LGLFDIFKKKSPALKVKQPEIPKTWPPISQETIQKSKELAEAIIADISTSGFFKPEKIPELSDKIRTLAVYSLYNFTDPFNYDNCLTLEEKRNYKFNTRQKISREMIEFMTEAGLSHDDPKNIIKNSHIRQSNIINNKYRAMMYKEIQPETSGNSLFSGYRFVSTLSTRTCLPCGVLDGKIFDSHEMPNVCLNEYCRCLMVPVVKGMEEKDPDDTRASEDGPVPANWTYEIWFKKQPVFIQKEILGKYYQKYKEGVPLAELAKLYKEDKKYS